MIKEIKGDLIALARQGNFDVIAHGCNCQNNMGAGIAVAMKNTFDCDKFPMEQAEYKGSKHKLGKIDYQEFEVSQMSVLPKGYEGICTQELRWPLTVVNAYTQYYYGKAKGGTIPLSYEALEECMQRINEKFKGKRIGLPMIGCGLAGGSWTKVKEIIIKSLKDCDVTVVIFDKI